MKQVMYEARMQEHIPLMPRVFLLHSPNVQIVNKSGSMNNFYDDLNHFICLYVPFVAHMITLVTCVHIKAVSTHLDYTLWIGKHIFM